MYMKDGFKEQNKSDELRTKERKKKTKKKRIERETKKEERQVRMHKTPLFLCREGN